MHALSAKLAQDWRMPIQASGWIITGLLALKLAIQLAPEIRRPAEFYSYFTAAQLVREGVPVARVYDDAWFHAQGARLVPGLNEIFNANMPTTVLAHVPFTLFAHPVDARLAWMLASLLLLVLFVEALIRIAGTGSAMRPYWYAAALVSQTVRSNLYQGQVYILVALGFILLLRAWRADRPISAGATLAGLLAYKTAGTMLWPVAAASGRWRMLFTGLAIFAFVVFATWPFIGSAGWSAYLDYLGKTSSSGFVRVPAYQSVEGFVRHFLSDQGREQFGSPIVTLSIPVARDIAFAAIALLLGATLYVARKYPRDDLVLAAALLLSLFAIPLSQAHTYVVAFVPAAMLVGRLGGRYLRWEGLAMWAGSGLVVLPFHYNSPRLRDGWAAFFAYPELYGALILWALCLLLAKDDPAGEALQEI